MSGRFAEAFNECRKSVFLRARWRSFLAHKTILYEFFVVYNTVVLKGRVENWKSKSTITAVGAIVLIS